MSRRGRILTGEELNAYLDGPPAASCDECGRKTWTKAVVDTPCAFPQPDGSPCPGMLRGPAPLHASNLADSVVAWKARAAAAEQQRDEAVGLLRVLEWADMKPLSASRRCPSCLSVQQRGHVDGCALSILLTHLDSEGKGAREIAAEVDAEADNHDIPEDNVQIKPGRLLASDPIRTTRRK